MPKPALQFVPARFNVLQIDLDRPNARLSARVLRGIEFLFPGLLKGENDVSVLTENRRNRNNKNSKARSRRVKQASYVRWPSRSGNTHALIQLTRPVSARERVFLQLALGSDPLRELNNWQRVKRGSPRPILFFEKGRK